MESKKAARASRPEHWHSLARVPEQAPWPQGLFPHRSVRFLVARTAPTLALSAPTGIYWRTISGSQNCQELKNRSWKFCRNQGLVEEKQQPSLVRPSGQEVQPLGTATKCHHQTHGSCCCRCKRTFNLPSICVPQAANPKPRQQRPVD